MNDLPQWQAGERAWSNCGSIETLAVRRPDIFAGTAEGISRHDEADPRAWSPQALRAFRLKIGTTIGQSAGKRLIGL